MMKTFLGLCILLAAGATCAETGRGAFLQQQAVAAYERLTRQMADLQSEQDSLAGRLRGNEDALRELDRMKSEVAALRAEVQALRQSQENLRAEIVKDLSARLVKMQREIAPPPAVPTPAAGGEIYTVMPGDTLSLIATAFHTSVGNLKRTNNLKSDALYVGQKIKVPAQKR